MIDRRRFMEMVGAGALLSPTSAMAGGPMRGPDADLDLYLQTCAESLLERFPEEATSLGFDVGANSGLRSRLSDRSPGGLADFRGWAQTSLAALRRLDRPDLTPAGRRRIAVAAFVFETLNDLLGRYGYIDLNLRPSPYVVSQMNGAYYWLPDSIGSRHPLKTREDLDAWLSRLNAFGAAVDQETARIRHDADLGVLPPTFVIDRTILQIRELRDQTPASSALIGPALKRAAAVGLGDVGSRAEAVFASTVAPALSRQIEALEALRPQAHDAPGAWRLPNGEAYYQAALRANTTLSVAPETLHRQGLAQVEARLADIDALLKTAGLTQGSVGARLNALARDPRFLVPNDDAGRAKIIAKATRDIEIIKALLPKAFNHPIVDPIDVRRAPLAVEGGAPSAIYQSGGDGQPGAFVMNLARPSDEATWRIATLAHHEGVPGHHYQFGIVRRAGSLPLFSRMLQFSAYTEGWALYAEQVADEIGAYDDDPFGRIGYLQSDLFRSARLVVDTGLHHKRWSRSEAVDWMVERIGEPREATVREVNRYCVYPGQACSFKVGANAIVAAREAARRRLGSRFDVRTFHDLVLGGGAQPLSVLSKTLDAWT